MTPDAYSRQKSTILSILEKPTLIWRRVGALSERGTLDKMRIRRKTGKTGGRADDGRDRKHLTGREVDELMRAQAAETRSATVGCCCLFTGTVYGSRKPAD